MDYLEKQPHPEEPTREVGLAHTSPSQVWFPQNEGLNSGNFQQADETAQLLRYLAVLTKGWYIVLLGAFLGILGAVFVTLRQTPVYRARTSLEVQNPNQTSSITSMRADAVRQEDVLSADPH